MNPGAASLTGLVGEPDPLAQEIGIGTLLPQRAKGPPVIVVLLG